MKTIVVHCKKEKFDVLVDRTTPFGNPFVIGVDGNRSEVIDKHIDWLYEWITNNHLIIISGMSNRWVTEHLHELKGRVLGCWCGKKDCHAKTLAALADALVIRTPHKWRECKCGECYFCRSELTNCIVCGGFEGTLTTDCCGRKLTNEEADRIYRLANLDFRNGEWVDFPNWSRSQPDGTFKCTDGIIRTRDEFIEWESQKCQNC